MELRHPALNFLLASLAVTAGLAAWMHGLRNGVDAYNTVGIFLSLFLYEDYSAALVMACLLPFALLPALRSAGLRCVEKIGRQPVVVSLVTAVVLAMGAVYVYHAHPLSMDEYAAVFQAKAFAAGRLSGQYPPELVDSLVQIGFEGYFFAVSHQSGHVASMYWPGFALYMTPFTVLGVPWLANPLLGALAVYLVHRLTLELTGSFMAAGLAALLTLASPAVTINAISYYSMTGHLVCNLAFMLLLLNPTTGRAFAAGLVGSLALVMHNPVPHALFAIPWLAWLLGRPDRWRTLPAAAAGYLPLCLLLGTGWPHVLAQLQGTAHAALPSSLEPTNVSGWLSRVGGLFKVPGLDALEDRAMALAKIWLWAVPGLPILSVVGLVRARWDIRVRLLAWSAALTIVAYLFVPLSQGHGWGFRYFHSAWFALPVLAVLCFWPLAAPSQDAAVKEAVPPLCPARLAGCTAACALLSVTVMTGLRMAQVEHFMARHLGQVPRAVSGTAQFVLIDIKNGYYARDLVQNDPFLRNRPIYVVAAGSRLDSDLLARECPGCKLLARNDTAAVWGWARPSERGVE